MMTYELDDIELEVLLGAVIERARADLSDGRPFDEMRQQVDDEEHTPNGDEPHPASECESRGCVKLRRHR